MAQSPDWNQLLETGKHFGEMTRAEAERRVQELIRRGELAQERFQATVDELLERSRRAADDLVVRGRQSADEIRDLVRTEVRRQMKALGLVTRDQLARVEARIPGRAAAKKTAAKKAPAKTAGATKAPGKKSTAKKSTAKKSAAKKSTAKKTGAKKTAAKKTAAKRTTAKKSTTKRSASGAGGAS